MNGFTETDSGNFVPAIVATGVWLGVGAALDVYLVATNKPLLISDVLRTKPGKVFLVVLALHVVNVLGRADPFSLVARTIQKRTGGGVVASTIIQSLSDEQPVSL